MRKFMGGGCLADLPWFFPPVVSVSVAVLVVISGVLVLVFKPWERMQRVSISSDRVYFVDNCRFVLETLVITKHIISFFFKHAAHCNLDCWWLTGFSLWCESFHMPLFACCSGLLSKGYLTPARAKRTIMRVVTPFLLLNYFVYPAQNAYLHMDGTPVHGYMSLYGGDIIPTPFEHQAITWFLYSWMTWRIITGVFLSTLSPHFTLAVCYVISWISGYWFDGTMKF